MARLNNQMVYGIIYIFGGAFHSHGGTPAGWLMKSGNSENQVDVFGGTTGYPHDFGNLHMGHYRR